MKIFCAEQALLSASTEQRYPMGHFFLRSDNTFTNSGKTLYTPDWSTDLEYTPVLVVRIGRVGKSIDMRHAHRYYDQIAIGISFMDTAYYQAALSRGLDPSLAYDFDGALVVSSFFPKEDSPRFIKHLMLHGTDETAGADLDLSAISAESIQGMISLISRYYLLKMGDCITIPLAQRTRKVDAPERHIYYTVDEKVILNASIA